MLQRTGAFVGSLLLAPEDHHDPAFGAELDDHIRTLVRDPDVVFLVDLDGVCIAPRIKVVTNFANVISFCIELKQLRRSGAIGRPRCAAARKDEDVPLRIDGNTCDLTEKDIRRQLEEIWSEL